MYRYRLTIEYDGTPFVGWQRQDNGPSVQERIEDAVLRFTGASAAVFGAGRTDAGVHASAQVAHLDLPREWASATVRAALNFHLRPAPIAILEAARVSDDFHARFSATQRSYRYRILNRSAPPALDAGRVWWVPVPLDVAAMAAAAVELQGRHDFTSFRATSCQAETALKTLDTLSVQRCADEIHIEARARSFLHNQVRILAGTLKRVGEGAWCAADMHRILAARNRSSAGPTAPAAGLCLLAVHYLSVGRHFAWHGSTEPPPQHTLAAQQIGSAECTAMQALTAQGERIVADLAQRYAISPEAVTTLLRSLIAGSGTMAQFSHPELGGMGQWSQGGMTMIGDMFNNSLKAKVDGLCCELSSLLARQPLLVQAAGGQWQSQSQGAGGHRPAGAVGAVSLFVPSSATASGGWWPAGLGTPASTGAQNDLRYAIFPSARRLVIEVAGRTRVYDTLDHKITGVSQQQSGDASLSFTSQHGLVRLADLPAVVSAAGDAVASGAAPSGQAAPASAAVEVARAPASTEPASTVAAGSGAAGSTPAPGSDAAGSSAAAVLATLERLAALHDKGILTDAEFTAKKAELLARL